MKDLSISDLSQTIGATDAPARRMPLVRLFFRAGPTFTRPPEITALDSAWQRVSDASRLGPLRSLDHEHLLTWTAALREARVAANRHTCPDLDGQLHQAIQRRPHTLVCAVLDVDPSACLNSALANRFPIELLAGVISVARISGAEHTQIILDHRVPSFWFVELKKAAHRLPVRVDEVIHTYPLADPAVLVYLLRHRPLRPGRLPTEQGVLVLDAPAAVALGRWSLRSEPMTHVPVAVRDHALNRSHYVTLPAGTTVATALTRLVLPLKGRIVRGGDFLRDVRLPPETPLGSGELILHSAAPEEPANPSPCMRCGWCVDACPTRVHPASVLEAAQRRDPTMAEQAGIEACIDCGLCSYVCPSSLPLLEGIRQMKSQLAP
jgi:electron transport complex protein RnfC